MLKLGLKKSMLLCFALIINMAASVVATIFMKIDGISNRIIVFQIPVVYAFYVLTLVMVAQIFLFATYTYRKAVIKHLKVLFYLGIFIQVLMLASSAIVISAIFVEGLDALVSVFVNINNLFFAAFLIILTLITRKETFMNAKDKTSSITGIIGITIFIITYFVIDLVVLNMTIDGGIVLFLGLILLFVGGGGYAPFITYFNNAQDSIKPDLM